VSGNDGVFFQTRRINLWKARALPAFVLVLGGLIAAWSFYLFATGMTDLIGLLALLVSSVGMIGIGYFGTFGRNPLAIAIAYVSPPGKPLFHVGMRDLAIRWRDVKAVEETQGLIAGPQEVSYAFALRTKNGRRYPLYAT